MHTLSLSSDGREGSISTNKFLVLTNSAVMVSTITGCESRHPVSQKLYWRLLVVCCLHILRNQGSKMNHMYIAE